MTTESRFSRQNDAGLRALTVVIRGNLVLVVVLVLESKASTKISTEFVEAASVGIPN